MHRFVNRGKELAFLEKEYSREGSALVVLYGRRRVGKTELTIEFMKDKPAIYFHVTEENEIQNLHTFKDIVADFFNNKLLAEAQLENWEAIFRVLAEYQSDKKLLVILDEFQYLGKTNPAFPSVLQKIWDTMLKNRNIMLILCGSLISLIEGQVLNYTSPLYGRRTGQIKLKQISFTHYADFFPQKKPKELVEFYAVTGGVPKYIEVFREEKNIYQAIENNILQKSSFLYDEPTFLLQNEVSEIGSYFSLIKTIAFGNHKLNKISSALEIKQTGLTKYLKTLIDLDILAREVPVTENNPEKSRRGLYKIKDNYLLFWFKFIYPNLSLIESGRIEAVLAKLKKNFRDSHLSGVYEEVCLEKIWQLNDLSHWDFVFDKAGRWWNNEQKIDIVAFDSGGMDIIFGECKYWQGKVGLNVLRALEEKAAAVEWKMPERREHYVLFAENGFTAELRHEEKARKNLLLFSLGDFTSDPQNRIATAESHRFRDRDHRY